MPVIANPSELDRQTFDFVIVGGNKGKKKKRKKKRKETDIYKKGEQQAVF